MEEKGIDREGQTRKNVTWESRSWVGSSDMGENGREGRSVGRIDKK